METMETMANTALQIVPKSVDNPDLSIALRILSAISSTAILPYNLLSTFSSEILRVRSAFLRHYKIDIAKTIKGCVAVYAVGLFGHFTYQYGFPLLTGFLMPSISIEQSHPAYGAILRFMANKVGQTSRALTAERGEGVLSNPKEQLGRQDINYYPVIGNTTFLHGWRPFLLVRELGEYKPGNTLPLPGPNSFSLAPPKREGLLTLHCLSWNTRPIK
ncbi:hypothetical protein EJ08DRAFT_60838 [Tothia fuscella]|uniref:BCS1 N-terminal domain-containing protein n=1 Tax=Tothia fuscella TaxID=1048955 RepID=A0A9P4NXQ7_9PEZI|nr:hypothetical protein EJ08DRAFT_60838 [Tothia fuscella]